MVAIALSITARLTDAQKSIILIRGTTFPTQLHFHPAKAQHVAKLIIVFAIRLKRH